jgi:hypothetical protein
VICQRSAQWLALLPSSPSLQVLQTTRLLHAGRARLPSDPAQAVCLLIIIAGDGAASGHKPRVKRRWLAWRERSVRAKQLCGGAKQLPVPAHIA